MAQPTRTCIGCRRRAAKSELVRIVRSPDEGVRLDPGGHAAGRGAYVCSNIGCLEEAIRRRRVERALRAAIEASALERLKEEFITWQR